MVSKANENGSYHLQTLNRTPLLRPWNVDNLKQYYQWKRNFVKVTFLSRLFWPGQTCDIKRGHCGILPKKCHVSLSPLHTQTIPLKTRDIAHSTRRRIAFGRRSILSGCLTIVILSGRHPTSSGYLTSGSGQRSTFSGYFIASACHRMREKGNSTSPVRHVPILW